MLHPTIAPSILDRQYYLYDNQYPFFFFAPIVKYSPIYTGIVFSCRCISLVALHLIEESYVLLKALHEEGSTQCLLPTREGFQKFNPR